MRSRLHPWWLVRVGLFILTFAVALIAFRNGVGVSDRPSVLGADVWTHIYYTIGLFVLDGLDLGVPVGGHVVMRVMLWVAYFLAPLITTSAVIEGAVRLLLPLSGQRQLRSVKGHVVIVGLGRVGMTFLEALRDRDGSVPIVVVEQDTTHRDVVYQRFKALHVSGDVRSRATLGAMRIEHARAVVLLTGDDLTNLEAAWHAVQASPHVLVLAHVADIRMRRLVSHSTPNEALERVRVFNSHRVAAQGLHEEHLASLFAETGPRDVVVIAGFGRFGQTILEYLQLEARGEVQRAIVVDLDASRKRRIFSDQTQGANGCELRCIDGSIDDPQTWEAVDRAADDLDVAPVFVICTDDDELNLRTAILLRSRRKNVHISVRCDYRSAFTEVLSAEHQFSVLAVDSMLRRTMTERMNEWTGVGSS